MLASIHNLHFYLNLMREIRDALDAGQPPRSRPSSAPTASAGSEPAARRQ